MTAGLDISTFQQHFLVPSCCSTFEHFLVLGGKVIKPYKKIGLMVHRVNKNAIKLKMPKFIRGRELFGLFGM